MISGVIGKKIGMTSVFDEIKNKRTAASIVQIGPCFITQIKTVEKDGYEAVQIGYGDIKEKNVSKSLQGHFKKAGAPNCRHLLEVKGSFDVELGQEVELTEFVGEGDFVDVVSTSKGKGFQGVVKRYNFGGVGGQTHGQHNRQRHPGSIGACSTPSRVFKGMRMGGRMGGERVKATNLRVLKYFQEKNLVILRGSVPGTKNGLLYLEK